MEEDFSTFRTPLYKEIKKSPVFVEETPSLFEELSAIAEEIEQCRKKILEEL